MVLIKYFRSYLAFLYSKYSTLLIIQYKKYRLSRALIEINEIGVENLPDHIKPVAAEIAQNYKTLLEIEYQLKQLEAANG